MKNIKLTDAWPTYIWVSHQRQNKRFRHPTYIHKWNENVKKYWVADNVFVFNASAECILNKNISPVSSGTANKKVY